jgi:hypothetical protein
MACSSRNAPQVTLARVAVMALARSGARNAAAFPTSASVASRSSIVACWIPVMMSRRQSPRLGLPALAGKGRCQVAGASSRSFEDAKVGVRFKIAALWIAMLFLFAYGDIFGFFSPGSSRR